MNEEGNVSILSKEIRDVFEKLGLSYEVIFVDDGSTDGTFAELSKLHKNNSKLKVIRFRKHYGKSAALSAGFRSSSGGVVITMDGDLQDDPSEIPKFLDKIVEGYGLVCGWRKKREDSLSKRAFSRIANSLRMLVTGEKIHDSACGFKAYSKEAVEDIDLAEGMHRYVPTIISSRGFRIGEVVVKHRRRVHGKTKYGYERLPHGFFDLLSIKFLGEQRERSRRYLKKYEIYQISDKLL
jgi:glycosyltransferase involved in cell wall biosynthesis